MKLSVLEQQMTIGVKEWNSDYASKKYQSNFKIVQWNKGVHLQYTNLKLVFDTLE